MKKFGYAHYVKILLDDSGYFRRKRETDGRSANPRRLIDTSIATDTIHSKKKQYEISDTEVRLPGLWALLKAGNFGLAMICYPVLFYRMRGILLLIVLAKNLVRYPLFYNMQSVGEYLRYSINPLRLSKKFGFEYKSLRKIVGERQGTTPTDSPAMEPLRKGR